MRILLACALVIGSVLTLDAAAADAARKPKRVEETRRVESKHVTSPHHHPRYRRLTREEVECERAEWADPTGQYAGYPCWAREALSPKPDLKW